MHASNKPTFLEEGTNGAFGNELTEEKATNHLATFYLLWNKYTELNLTPLDMSENIAASDDQTT